MASAMGPLLRRSGGIWIGWSGVGSGEDSEERRTVLQDWASKERFFAIELPADIGKRFYEGYANQALWPVFGGASLPSRP